MHDIIDDLDIAALDQHIAQARHKFRALVQAHADLFGGVQNPRREATIAEHASYGTIAMLPEMDATTTAGLMAAVDLTLLDKQASPEAIDQIARRAKAESVAAVCVYPQHVTQVQAITGGNPPPIAVVGFPSVPDPVSAIHTTLKETRDAIRDGAREIDMVLPLDFRQANPDYRAHYDYIRHVVAEAGAAVPVKVILETAYLTDAQKIEACMLAKMAGATFVKTSTGFAEDHLMRPEIPAAQKGATPHDIALMRRCVGDTTLTDHGETISMGVKASGGVRDRAQAVAVCEAGANRIGASMGLDVRSNAEKQVEGRINTERSGESQGRY